MHPYFFETIPAYPVALAAAVIGSALLGAYGLRRAGLPLSECVRVQLVLACTGLVGAKLHSLIERGGAPAALQHELTQGYRYPGAIIALLVVMLLCGQRLSRGVSLAAMGDALAPSVGVGAALLRVGCFLYGCCFGLHTNLPWALSFPAQSPPWHAHVAAGWVGPASAASLPVHPLQLYFIAVSLTAAGIAWWLQTRKAYDGQTVLVFLVVDGTGRFLLETVRHSSPPGVQLASLLVAIVALGVVLAAPLITRMSVNAPAAGRRALSDPT